MQEHILRPHNCALLITFEVKISFILFSAFFCLKFAASVQVAFGPGDSSSPTLRTYGVNKGVNSGKSSGSSSKDFSTDLNALTLSSTAIEDKSDTRMTYGTEDTTNASAWKNKREYKEPWVRNCHQSFHSPPICISVVHLSN